jgi:hypothetical protein
VRDRSTEDAHHGFADELLQTSSKALDLVFRGGMVGAQPRPHVLRISLLRLRADEVGKENAYDLALFAYCGRGGRRRRAGRDPGGFEPRLQGPARQKVEGGILAQD